MRSSSTRTCCTGPTGTVGASAVGMICRYNARHNDPYKEATTRDTRRSSMVDDAADQRVRDEAVRGRCERRRVAGSRDRRQCAVAGRIRARTVSRSVRIRAGRFPGSEQAMDDPEAVIATMDRADLESPMPGVLAPQASRRGGGLPAAEHTWEARKSSLRLSRGHSCFWAG